MTRHCLSELWFYYPFILSLIVFIFLKYLQFKGKIKRLTIILIVLFIQLFFCSYTTISGIINEKENTKKYYSIIDPDGKNIEGIFHYEELTDEEKKFIDFYFSDSGRRVGILFYIVNCIINLAVFLIASVIIDIIGKSKKKKQKL